MAQIQDEVDDNHQEVEASNVSDTSDVSDEYTKEREKFLADLAKYHEKRG